MTPFALISSLPSSKATRTVPCVPSCRFWCKYSQYTFSHHQQSFLAKCLHTNTAAAQFFLPWPSIFAVLRYHCPRASSFFQTVRTVSCLTAAVYLARPLGKNTKGISDLLPWPIMLQGIALFLYHFAHLWESLAEKSLKAGFLNQLYLVKCFQITPPPVKAVPLRFPSATYNEACWPHRHDHVWHLPWALLTFQTPVSVFPWFTAVSICILVPDDLPFPSPIAQGAL